MWSTDFSGRYGVFTQQQRLLFPVRDTAEITKKCLLLALLRGTCTGIAVLTPEDRGVLVLVRQTLATVIAKNPQFQRARFTIVVHTSPTWSVEALSDRIHDVVDHLQLDTLDVLLLTRPPALLSPLTTSQRKQIVLPFWDVMCSIQQRGLARTIGVCDFTIQEIEFMFTAMPTSPPSVLSVTATLAPLRATTNKSTILRAVASFAHGRRMEVVVQFAYHTLDKIPAGVSLRDQWQQVVEGIAERQRAKPFDVQLVHEAEQEAFHLEKRDMSETNTLQSGMQIILRYLTQKGVVVVPLPDSDDHDDHLTEEEGHEMFWDLIHPFANAPPARSPQVQYSSILSKEDLHLIDQVLPLVVSFTE